MSDYDIGYGKPPRRTRFKAGISGNPKGRPKKKPSHVADAISNALRVPIQYREGDTIKVGSHRELVVKRLVREAIKGNLAAAEFLLKLRADAARGGDGGFDQLVVENWLPSRPGQTGGQKTREHAERQEADPIAWWEKPDSSKRRSKHKKS